MPVVNQNELLFLIKEICGEQKSIVTYLRTFIGSNLSSKLVAHAISISAKFKLFKLRFVCS